MTKVVKISIVINLGDKYCWIISNTNIDKIRDLELICIKKYQRCTGQIQAKVDQLYKD